MQTVQTHKLIGKVAFITGASRGIGLAIGTAFARAGAKLALVSQSEKVWVAQEAIALYHGAGSPLAFQADIRDEEAMKAAAQQTFQHYGRIDVLINDAAVMGPKGPLIQNDAKDWFNTIAVNVGGTFIAMKAVLPIMIEQRSGSIINFSGGGAATPSPNFSAYGCSKAAVVRLTETVAGEVREHGIRVNVIAPGANHTDMLKEFLDAGGEVRTYAKLDDPVNLSLFLASDQSRHVTGKFIHVFDDWKNFTEDNILGDRFTMRRVEA